MDAGIQCQTHSPVEIGTPGACVGEVMGDIVVGAPVAPVGAGVVAGASVIVSLHRHSLLLLHDAVLRVVFTLRTLDHL